MKILVAILVAGALIWLIIGFLRSQKDAQKPISVTREKIPYIVSQLKRTGRDGSFVVFMFSLPEIRDEVLPNLQYSIENGKLGFDWVLIAPQNVKDELKMADFIKVLGYSLTKHEMNDVQYLRVEGDGLDDLGIKILRDFYHLSSDAKLEPVTEGFEVKE
jgi:hypothetical protein